MLTLENIDRALKEIKQISYKLPTIKTEIKNKVLLRAAKLIEERKEKILEANKKDYEYAKSLNKPSAFLDRLLLNEKRISQMINVLKDVSKLEDPVGKVDKMWTGPDGLKIGKMRVPLGTIMIIYESRPNVTVEAAALCIKSSNAVILRGGKETINTNKVLVDILKEACQKEGYPSEAILFIDNPDRELLKYLLKKDEFIDVVIPRGGEGLIRFVAENARMPVIKHYKGVCHTYVDEDADIDMAIKICFNAKVQRPGVCNAMECMVVHENILEKFLPPMIEKFLKANVKLKMDEPSFKIAQKYFKEEIEKGQIEKAKPEDFGYEFLDLILAVKTVKSFEEAIDFINTYGSHHSDAIVTNNYLKAKKFLESIDSAAVYVNASTRFTDGNVFGLGAEMGISTDKIHVRGPMGLEDLTIGKFIILGEGQIRN